MAFVFNIAKGRVAELYHRVKTADPAAATLIVVPVSRGAATDAALKDLETLAAVLAVVTERTTGGWGRLSFVAADLAALAPNHGADKTTLGLPASAWAEVLVGSGQVTDLILCYSTGSDATAIPLTMQAYPIVPDGRGITLIASDFFEAN